MKRSQCTQCQRPMNVCFCHTLDVKTNPWPIHILQHPNEVKHAIGTARIAQLSLSNCQTHVLNCDTSQAALREIFKGTEPLLIYPGKNSIPIQKIDRLAIRPLIFLDGSWRKTRRMIFETPEIDAMSKVTFSPSSPSRYRIRKAPTESAVSTLEAIVTVLSELENDKDKYLPLLSTMDWMINKQIELMGQAVYEKNYTSVQNSP